MSRCVWMIACVATGIVLAAHAAEDNVRFETRLIAPSIVAPRGEPFDLWDGFKNAFDDQANEIFTSQFHPLNAMNWTVKLSNEDDPGPLRQRPVNAAQSAFTKSFFYSLREATVDLPIMHWLEERQEFLMGLFENSIAGVEEEAVEPLSLSYRQAERSWRKAVSESGIRYGVRPFRTDPYAYLSFRLRDGQRIRLLTHVRYHFVNFGDHSFELAFSVPLTRGFSMSLGTAYQFGRHDEEKRVALKLTREFKRGSIFHVGLELNERPAFLAGITVPM